VYQSTPQPQAASGCYGLSGAELAVIEKESTCNPDASNGQYHGLGQVAGESSSDPQTQLNDANSYVIERYGSWAAAWAHEEADGWY
jgi:hypothetical protein